MVTTPSHLSTPSTLSKPPRFEFETHERQTKRKIQAVETVCVEKVCEKNHGSCEEWRNKLSLMCKLEDTLKTTYG